MILVTGAAGLSGSLIIQECARQGLPVRALVRSRAKAAALATLPGVEIVEGDMLRPETLAPALDGVARALMISSAGPQMVETQCAFIGACQQAGVAHVVKFSGKESNDGFDPAKFLFMRMHEEIERHLEASGLAWTHLRPSQFMQVYLREAQSIRAEDSFALPAGDIRLAPIDLQDVARIAVALLREGGHAGRSFAMTGPEALTMAEIAARISQAAGRPIRYVNITPEEKRRRSLAAGMPPYFADALDDQARERLRHPDSPVRLETHATFGITPTPFAEFARRHAAVFGRE